MSTDFLDNPFRPSNSVFEPDTWLDQFNQLWYDYFNDRDPADDFDDFDRIERAQEANRLVDLIEAYDAGTVGYEQFMAEFNTGDTFNEIPGFDDWIKETRDAVQYDSMLNDWAIVSKSDDPQAIQDFVSLYNRTGILDNSFVQADLASTGSATSVITGTIDNSILDAVIKKAAMGDGSWVGTVKLEDLPGYGGIWEGLIRHVKVSIKGLGLPIPDWLPLPGIFDLPSIGEIFDTVTGPWVQASKDALRDCMDPDGDGVDDKPASVCLEEQSVIDILVDGIGNVTSDIYDATSKKVQDIFGKEGVIDRCASNPSGCAQEVFDKIKDIFGEGAVDPTATGGNIPDWLKVIIIGGAYGDEILGELEDLFGGDIDGDELIGTPEDPTVTPPVTPEFDCASVFKSGGTVTDESQCGGCLQGYDPDGQGNCIEAPIECPGEQVYNDLTGQCEDPEPGFVEGDPCKTEAGESGTYNAEGGCVADPVTPEPEPSETGVDCTQPKPAGFAGVSWQYACGDTHCTDGSLISDHPNNDCSIPIGTEVPSPESEEASPECDQQDRVTNPDGSCGECKPGFTPDPQGFDQCIQAPPECNDCSCAEYAAANPAECTTCPEGESYCASTGQCEAEGACPAAEEAEEGGAGGGGGGGGGGGRSMFAPLTPVITASPQLLTRQDFPITDFLAGIFTNSTGGRNV